MWNTSARAEPTAKLIAVATKTIEITFGSVLRHRHDVGQEADGAEAEKDEAGRLGNGIKRYVIKHDPAVWRQAVRTSKRACRIGGQFIAGKGPIDVCGDGDAGR